MNLAELLRSRAFRLALFYVALFAGSVGALLAVIYWSAGRYLATHIDGFVDSEIAMLRADHEVDGQEGMISMMRERMAADHGGRWLYLYVDAAGRKLAGNAPAWPDVEPGPDGSLVLPARNEDEASQVHARSAVLPDGSRLLVGLDDYERFELREALARAIVLGLGLTVLLALGGGVLVVRASLRQIEAVNRVIHEVMAGDLQRRVPVGRSGDELDCLGANINAMLDRIQELLRAVKGATDNIAHDLRAPLARHRARLESARTQPPHGAELEQFIGRSLEEIDAILATFSALLRLASIESGELKQGFAAVDLGAIARDAEQVYEPLAATRRQSLRVTVDGDLRVRGSRDLLFQAVSNLLDNAVKYAPDCSRLELSIRRAGGTVEVAVADNGSGIPPAERKRVFQRLYRMDSSRSTPGSGLGLSLARAIALLHGGTCEILDNGPGARVVISLPLERAAAA